MSVIVVATRGVPASVVEDTALAFRNALVVSRIGTQLIVVQDLCARALKLLLRGRGDACLELVGVEVGRGLLCDLGVVGHLDAAIWRLM